LLSTLFGNTWYKNTSILSVLSSHTDYIVVWASEGMYVSRPYTLALEGWWFTLPACIIFPRRAVLIHFSARMLYASMLISEPKFRDYVSFCKLSLTCVLGVGKREAKILTNRVTTPTAWRQIVHPSSCKPPLPHTVNMHTRPFSSSAAHINGSFHTFHSWQYDFANPCQLAKDEAEIVDTTQHTRCAMPEIVLAWRLEDLA
jgi:hypothetical protein